MKTFKGHKSSAKIKAQCKALGLVYDDAAYRQGSDYVKVSGGGGVVLYSTVNGRFFGETDRGVSFSSDHTRHEKAQWFQTLLSFFYREAA